MPYKSEKMRLPETKDRRKKLTEEQREQIRKIYATGICGQRPLAKQFGVSKKTIQLIVKPEAKQRQHDYNAENWRKYRPSKEEWAATIREHRRYKQELYLKGELKDENISREN